MRMASGSMSLRVIGGSTKAPPDREAAAVDKASSTHPGNVEDLLLTRPRGAVLNACSSLVVPKGVQPVLRSTRPSLPWMASEAMASRRASHPWHLGVAVPEGVGSLRATTAALKLAMMGQREVPCET
mmetsp:Transcript_16351/g.29125  ORF Transcript_16351/g.29125 Transcript_16351/m.29125 type:complete len:127 (+) Transcript_16351:1-381(+)